MQVNRNTVGIVNEEGCKAFLESKYPLFNWTVTEKWSKLDMVGVDIIGDGGNGIKRFVQVKSSMHFAREFMSRGACKYLGEKIEVWIPEGWGWWKVN
jgi:hypothetical protein